MKNRVVELFGHAVGADVPWASVVAGQQCPFTSRSCVKTRKSDASIAIGTCTVMFGRPKQATMICPHRLLAGGTIFKDCVGLLKHHEPSNSLCLVPEVQIPGGNVDYFLVSTHRGEVRDFVGIELQTLDTTGSVWPERQRLIRELGLPPTDDQWQSDKPFGMNWKMTAKTILMQLHHKVATFENVGKSLVLVVQDVFLDRIQRDFRGAHLHAPARTEDSLQVHSYTFGNGGTSAAGLSRVETLSTDSDGVVKLLGLEADAQVELSAIEAALRTKLQSATRLQP